MTVRSLLEHVGAVEPGQRIWVDGREVDRPSRADRLRYLLRKIYRKRK